MQAIKYLNFIIPAIVLGIIIFSLVRSFKEGVIKRNIAKNPINVDATIVKLVPGTPSSQGLVNLTFDYKFTDNQGVIVTKKNYMTVVKTMDLYTFNVGGKVSVIYQASDSSKNMLSMKNALENP